MVEWVVGSFLARHVGTERPLPRVVRALLDETFLWVLLGQVLLALGVRRESVRRLAEVQGVIDGARSLFAQHGYEIPCLEGIETSADLDRFASRFDPIAELVDSDPSSPEDPSEDSDDSANGRDREELARILPASVAVNWAQDAGGVLLDLAEEVLDRLRTQRIRPELVGLDHSALRVVVLEARRQLGSPGLQEAARRGYPALEEHLGTLGKPGSVLAGPGLETRPRAPRPGEVQRLVGVIRRIPRETLHRLLPVHLLASRVVLGTALALALRGLRSGWVPPGQRPAPDAPDGESTTVAAERDAQRRWERRREQARRAVAERDARPEVRQGQIMQAALLWLSSALLLGWIVLAAGAVFAPGVLAGAGVPEALLVLWPVPALAVIAVAVGVGFGTSSWKARDQLELRDLRSAGRSAPAVEPARRARVRAVRTAEGLLFLLVMLPIGVPLLQSIAAASDWGIAAAHREGAATLGQLALGIGSTGGAALIASVAGQILADRYMEVHRLRPAPVGNSSRV